MTGVDRRWEEPAGRRSVASPAHVAFSPDGRALAYTARGNAAVVVDTTRFLKLARLEGHGIYLLGLAFAPDGRLACASRDGAVRLWDVAPAVGAQDR